MDLKMPGLDGYEATRRLRRLEAAYGWSPTPIVALTANALDESRRSCMAAGFDAFLVKPVDLRALAGTLERVCAAGSAPGASVCERDRSDRCPIRRPPAGFPFRTEFG